MSSTLSDPRVQSSLVRAAVYQVLSMGLAYPDTESLLRLRQVADLAVEESEGLGEAVRGALERVASAAWEAEAIGAAGEHSRLFSGEVLCTPYETEYETDPFAKSRQLADISGFYLAWGVELSEEHRTMPDFIGTQAEYMSLLCGKEAHAVDQGWEDKAAISADAQSAFLAAHLGRWFEVLADQVVVAARPGVGDLYRNLAVLLKAFVAAELAARQLDPRRLTRRMVSDGQLPVCDPKVVGDIPTED